MTEAFDNHDVPEMANTGRGSFINCPVCNAKTCIYSGVQVSPIVKIIWAQCRNITCGQTTRHQIFLEYVICPSAIPNDLNLPQAPSGLRHHNYKKPANAERDPNQMHIFELFESPP